MNKHESSSSSNVSRSASSPPGTRNLLRVVEIPRDADGVACYLPPSRPSPPSLTSTERHALRESALVAAARAFGWPLEKEAPTSTPPMEDLELLEEYARRPLSEHERHLLCHRQAFVVFHAADRDNVAVPHFMVSFDPHGNMELDGLGPMHMFGPCAVTELLDRACVGLDPESQTPFLALGERCLSAPSCIGFLGLGCTGDYLRSDGREYLEVGIEDVGVWRIVFQQRTPSAFAHWGYEEPFVIEDVISVFTKQQ